MDDSSYGEIFRGAYATLHGGRPEDFADASERNPGEPLEAYLARTRGESLGMMRKRLLAAEPPSALLKAHELLIDLLSNAAIADEALAAQVRAYQCGQFHESLTYSDHLQELVVSSQRMDRELIAEIHGLPDAVRSELGIDV